MKKRNILLTVLFLSVLVLNSCKNDDNSTNPNEASNGIIPLKIGNYWSWNYTVFDDSGNKMITYDRIERVDYDTVINNQRWYVTIMYYETNLYTNNSDGYYSCHYTGSGPISAPVLNFKYPGKVGDTWNNNDGSKMRINSTNLKYSIPLGEFICYEYIRTAKGISDNYDRILVSPGIGIITREYNTKKGSSSEFYLSRKEVLTDYKVN